MQLAVDAGGGAPMNMWNSPEFDAHEQVCFFTDAATGLRSIVAIHSTALGPAAGAEQLAGIHDRLCEIFARSDRERRPPEVIAEQMARESIGR